MLKPLDFFLVAILLVVSLLVGGSLLIPGVCGVSHDDAIYAITAKSLAQGDGYCLINLPWSPEQTKYPILYPALLSLIWKLYPSFPENLVPMKWLSIVSGAVAIGLGYLYLVRWQYTGRGIAFCGALLCTFSSWYWYCSTLAQTEAPFACLLIWALWCLERLVRNDKSKPFSELLSGIVLTLPLICRVLGAPLIPAALWLLFRLRRRLHVIIAGMALVAGPWAYSLLTHWGAYKSNPVQGYYTDYIGWWSDSGYGLLTIIATNCLIILMQSSVLVLSGLHMLSIEHLGKGYLIIAPFVGLALWYYLWQAKSQKPVLPFFMALYVIMLCICPWPPGRYLVPLLPLLSGLLIAGLFALIKKTVLGKTWFLTSVAITLIAANIVDVSQKAIVDKQHGYPSLPFERQQLSVNWSSYLELFAWLKEHSSPNAIIASEFDTMIYLYTGNQCVRPCPVRAVALHYMGKEPPVGTVNELVNNLRQLHADYLVSMPIPGFAEEKPFFELVSNTRKEKPKFLQTVYVGTDPRFVIYKCNFENKKEAGE